MVDSKLLASRNNGLSSRPQLLIVEDDDSIRTQLKWALGQDYTVSLAEHRKAALETFRSTKPPIVTLDLGLPPHAQDVTEGFETLNEILQVDRNAKIIVITGREEREFALRAIANGAYDFFCKPIQIEELKVVLRRAYYLYCLERENRELARRLDGDAYEGMLGTVPQMQDVFARIRKLATTDAPVLICGESGTGKELVARAIHRKSARREGPFAVINCGAIPETLLESELFGHEKGAFTGAHIQRRGRIEMADGGTLFLDEIGELPLSLQVKLLRFLQEHVIERVGGRERIHVNVRVTAATNSDLKKAMAAGRFREDLYYRLGVVIVDVPPLRERENDIILLAKAFLQRYSSEGQKKAAGFTQQALRALSAYSWPGNVRELENRVKRAVIMAEASQLTPADLELDSASGQYLGLSLREAREVVERELIQQALARHKGQISQSAADLGISRPTLYDLMEKLGIRAKDS